MSWPAFAAVALVLIVIIVLGYRRHWPWTGLEGKTLWDWLDLFLIPVALAGLAFLLNSSEASREQRREDERTARQRATAADATREEALRAYLTQMSGLMLDRNLKRSAEPSVRAVARTVTLTTLRRLNGRRRGLVVRFLRAARLLETPNPRVQLTGANLLTARLKGATLEGADLSGANLAKANLRLAILVDADLKRANLPKANLRRAVLNGADLDGADLRWADLRSADLARGDLGRGADLSGADLRGTVKLGEANLAKAKYDSTTRWPARFDPVAAGAEKQDR